MLTKKRREYHACEQLCRCTSRTRAAAPMRAVRASSYALRVAASFSTYVVVGVEAPVGVDCRRAMNRLADRLARAHLRGSERKRASARCHNTLRGCCLRTSASM